jgi:hypothetical protein
MENKKELNLDIRIYQKKIRKIISTMLKRILKNGLMITL